MARTSGILLHPTSLPGAHGIGTLGPQAHRFVDVLAEMGQSWWQMLPVGPTGYGDSPYQSPSTFAGNPLLVSLEALASGGLLEPGEIEPLPGFPTTSVDFGALIPWKAERLEVVARQFSDRADDELAAGFEIFCDTHDEVWLADFALFTAIKRERRLLPWWEWERPLALRQPHALRVAADELAAGVRAVKIEQFLFDRQFSVLRRTCRDRGIGLIGDLPIFVAHDSADVWAHRDLYHLDDDGMPSVVAGVPPDYFSATGQRWGNPLYDWDRHRQDGFAWWTERMRRAFQQFDLVRIDHFRGFLASWHIPAGEETAMVGEWVEAPGRELFDRLVDEFGDLPVIAEDLGIITPDVEELRDSYGFPGMKVLQFGFGAESAHAPEEFHPRVVAYPGTHDNDTAAGWFADDDRERREERRRAREVLGGDGTEPHWDMVSVVMASAADLAVVPLQDLIGLGSEARMNVPGTTRGNWTWRFTWPMLTSDMVLRMRQTTEATHRSPS